MTTNLVITQVDPGEKNYHVRTSEYGDYWFCFPSTEEEKIELLLVYGGNVIHGDLRIYQADEICELPTGLEVHGTLHLDYVNIKYLPPDLVVHKDLYARFTLINDIPETVRIGQCILVTNKLTSYRKDVLIWY